MYEASALVQVVSGRQASGEFVSREELLHLTNVFARVARTTTIAERAADDGEGTVAEYEQVEVTSEPDVEVLRFTSRDRSPVEAARRSNEYAEAFVAELEERQEAQRAVDVLRLQERIDAIEEQEPTRAGSPAPPSALLEAYQTRLADRLARSNDMARLLEPATPPTEPSAPNPIRDAVLAAVAVLALGMLLVYFRTASSDRFSSLDQIVEELGLPSLGELPRSRRSKGAEEEAFRTLRTSLDFGLRGRDEPVIVVTSAQPASGKTHVIAGLARSFAADGRRVVAVDSDVRRPTLHDRMGVPLEPGLGELLTADRLGVAELQVSGVSLPTLSRRGGDLDVVAAGGGVPDPAEALASGRMEHAVRMLRTSYDVVLLDSPPLLGVADALVLARYASAVVLVVDRRRDRRTTSRRAVEMLRSVDAPVVGFVLNGAMNAGRVYGAYGNRASLGSRGEAPVRTATGR